MAGTTSSPAISNDDATSASSQTRVSFVYAFGGYLRTLASRFHSTVRVTAVFITSLLTVVSLGPYAAKYKSDLFEFIAGRSFCCPEDAREVAKFVNTSIDPCHDFYTRVCAEGLRFKLWKQLARQSELEDIVTTGVVPRGLRATEVTRFLIAYYKSCVETIPHKEDFIWDLARHLARATRKLLFKPDPRNALIFAATTMIKYKLPSIVDINLEPGIIELCPATVYTLRSLFPKVLKSSMKAVTGVTRFPVKPDEVSRLTESVKRRLESRYEEMAWRGGTGDDLKPTLWNVVALRSALAAIGYVTGDKTSVRVKGVAGVLAVHDTFAEGGPDGARATYLLMHSVASGAQRIYESRHVVMTDAVVRSVCKKSVQEIAEVWDTFTAETLATFEKENQLRAIFLAVRDAVYHECSASVVFDDVDSARIGELVQNVSLDLTMEATRAAIAVPKSTSEFAENLLRARAYNFDIQKERRRAPETQAYHIWIPPVMYDMIRTGPGTRSNIPNMAAMGWLIAQAIWEVVLSSDLSPKAQAAIQRLHSCFDTDEHGAARNVSVPLVLGMSSVLKAFGRPKWDTVRPAWGTVRMSHGQMFYTLAVYYNCPMESTPQEVVRFNEALMYDGDFASVFRCPADSPMARRLRCSI
ncbi:hypothetical protein HPB50_003841 [Hyalomma asiaticum]|uniref:Uncharacterized protein n=1 Tax=Hyalomma asiaticum TaxID=266040 RepID=A0ACB7RHG4_HYAAI|nr:hypothetical protein HPB50_003841 [Hyalomma asiaticum]